MAKFNLNPAYTGLYVFTNINYIIQMNINQEVAIEGKKKKKKNLL